MSYPPTRQEIERAGFVYFGRCLEVKVETDDEFRELFPKIDLQGEYRLMDAWLMVNPRNRPKLYKRFMVNWLKKIANADRKSAQKHEELRKALDVGAGPSDWKHL